MSWPSTLFGADGVASVRFVAYSPVSENCGTKATSCACAKCAAASAQSGIAPSPRRDRRRLGLRDDDDITGLEQHVLIEIAPLHDLAVADGKAVLRVAR